MENKRLTSVDLSKVEFFKSSKKATVKKESLNAASYGAEPLPPGNAPVNKVPYGG